MVHFCAPSISMCEGTADGLLGLLFMSSRSSHAAREHMATPIMIYFRNLFIRFVSLDLEFNICGNTECSHHRGGTTLNTLHVA